MARAPLNILVVEDHPDTLEVFGWFLEGLGYRCRLASTVDLALSLAHAEMFDVLFTDVWLKGQDGCELVVELRRRGCLPRWAFSMSAGDDRLLEARSKRAGCHRHFVKPMMGVDLGAVLQEIGYAGVDSDHSEHTRPHAVADGTLP